MPIKNIAIFAKVHDPRCQQIARDLINWLDSRGLQPLAEEHLTRHLGLPQPTADDEIRDKADLVVVLGGDGTLLSVARLFSGRQIPILGVNLGSLGFLTDTTVEELYPLLERCLNGEIFVCKRMMLTVGVRRDGRIVHKCDALNDVVISKGALARILDLETTINQHMLTTFKSDGLIISTPTGSTGHSMSAGGPIVHPRMSCIIINPICPHTLTNRPIVLSDQSIICVTLSSYDKKAYLTVDGQVGFELQEGDEIEVQRSQNTTDLIMPSSRDYFEVLRTKLKWGER